MKELKAGASLRGNSTKCQRIGGSSRQDGIPATPAAAIHVGSLLIADISAIALDVLSEDQESSATNCD